MFQHHIIDADSSREIRFGVYLRDSSDLFNLRINTYKIKQMTRLEIAALRLWHIMPLETLTHFAKQQSKTTDQVCLDVVTYAPEWAYRITESLKDWSLNDLRHDFVGLVNKDEFFLPRL